MVTTVTIQHTRLPAAASERRMPHAACHKLHTAHRTRYVEGKCHKRFGTECDDLKAKLIIMRIDSSKIDRYNKEEGIN